MRAQTLLEGALSITLPAWTEVEVREATFSELSPAEYRADLVVLLRQDLPVFALVLEVQLAIDEKKRFRWPCYAVGIRDRWECPSAVLVVTPEARVAEWASQPIPLGAPGSVFRTIVLGPAEVPWVRPGDDAPPEAAILSALAHARDPDGLETVLAAVAAAASLDDERSGLYYDLVLSRLDGATRAALEALMQSPGYEYQSDFARKYFSEGKAAGEAKGKAEGEAKGKADALRGVLLDLLELRGVALTPSEEQRIAGATDLAALREWCRRAPFVTTARDVFETPAG